MTTQINWTKVNNNTQTTEIEGRIFIAQKRVITTGKGNEPIVKWFIYRNDAQRPYADAYLWEPDLRTAKAKFVQLVETQLAQEKLAQLVKAYEEDYPTYDQPQPAPIAPQPLPPTVEPTYPLDIEVTTSERNSLVSAGLLMDMHIIASHTIRIYSAREHAAITQHLDEMKAGQHAPKTKGKIGDSNHIPLNTTDKWQVWQFLFGWFLVSEHDTEAAANEANDEVYNGKVVAPEPMADQPQPLGYSDIAPIFTSLFHWWRTNDVSIAECRELAFYYATQPLVDFPQPLETENK